ncbi:hypothetical protein FQA39_LY06925 [Lamprigera yunnana]|nr:hypothetical protein FQA39_LY06925 [Lamprigera yunnana]
MEIRRTVAIHFRDKNKENFMVIRQQGRQCYKILLYLILDPGTDYQTRLWGASSNYSLLGPHYSKWVKTHSLHYTPLPVWNITNTTWKTVENSYNTLIEWKPADDQNCFYMYLWYMSRTNEHISNQVEGDISLIDDLLQLNLTNLELEANYTVEVSSVTEDAKRESNTTKVSFVTPSCLEVFNNLNVCVPPEPQIVNIEESLSDDSDLENQTFNIKVTWLKPTLNPNNYFVSVSVNSTMTAAREYQIVPGNATFAVFYNIPFAVLYQIELIASSSAGNSTYTITEKRISWPRLWSNTNPTMIIVCGITVLFTLLIVLYFLHRRYKRRQRRKLSKKQVSNDYGSDMRAKIFPGLKKQFKEDALEVIQDKWKLINKQVTFDEVLGEGAFGIVRKGYMKNVDGIEVEVAIKMLKGNPSSEEMKQFEREIEIMKSVGTHPHLVSLLGCCSKLDYMGPFLVVEYCAKGNLQTYLRAVWERLEGQPTDLRYVNTPCISENDNVGNYFSNKVYVLSDDIILKPGDLLSFARQITMGMEYLSNLKVVHRDLAARNVLICENGTVKVADFGLSRDVYQDNIYLKTGTGKLPVKWMALESLSHQQYTTQSDVWSFGVVLWEIVSLGANPYATLSAGDILSVLKSGYRMECPKNCSQELYSIMQVCWKEIPTDRPNFNQLRLMLEKLSEDENRYVTVDIIY